MPKAPKKTVAPPPDPKLEDFAEAFIARVQELGCEASIVSRGRGFITLSVAFRRSSGGLVRQTFMLQNVPEDAAFAAHIAAHAVAKVRGVAI
jgi:hypothetical protein